MTTATATSEEVLQAENALLKKQLNRGIHLKVSEKGGISLYGLGRFPVTLYREQWEKIVELSEAITKFIRENEAKLKVKE